MLSLFRLSRLLLMRWRRLTRWEFWPPWVFYGPVALYVLVLMMRFRSLTLFTAANPAIPAGGVIGESKYEILAALRQQGAPVPRSTLLSGRSDARAKLAQAAAFIRTNHLSYPVVLKANQGQRGSGVVMARGAAALAKYVAAARGDIILQEYVPGAEFGVFYYRYPSSDRGHIFSITEKQLPVVTGDGRRTVEALILDDDHAVCMADRHLARHAALRGAILRPGARLPLIDVASHCRGALFLNGGYLCTPRVTAAFDEIGRRYDGFFFGRFDVRAPSRAAFQDGQFQIIELNGVTSEATHIYHPGTSLLAAYRVLCRQWRIAFEIGRENAARGAAPASITLLHRLFREYRAAARWHLRPEGTAPAGDPAEAGLPDGRVEPCC